MRWRRSPFRVTTSYAEHFHLVSVHMQKPDFHDDCPTHRGVTNPQNSAGGDCTQIWRVATKRSGLGGVDLGANNFYPLKISTPDFLGYFGRT
jgi:hypothetical protein